MPKPPLFGNQKEGAAFSGSTVQRLAAPLDDWILNIGHWILNLLLCSL